ncbi:MAG: hypothetical protein AAF213_01760 [Pseudomonadota bacterium]
MHDRYLRYTLESGSTRIFNCLDITKNILSDHGLDASDLELTKNADQRSTLAANGDGQTNTSHKNGKNGDSNGSHGHPQDYESKQLPTLFFENHGLNFSIFIKDMNPDYRRGDESSTEKPIGTKIYVPFDVDNAHAGGKSIFASDRGFRNAITELIGEGTHIDPQAIARDLELINILDTMPALDPFLVRDMMMSRGMEIDERYFQINDTEWDRIQDHIRQRIRPMVSLALPDGVMHSEERMGEMIDAIWKAQDVRKLMPLIKAFLLPVEKTGEIFYAWKGIAFFEYHYKQLSEPAINFARWLQDGAKPSHSITAQEEEEFDTLREGIRNKLKGHWSTSTTILKNYSDSYEQLFKEQGSAVAFMNFMADAPNHFWHLGDAIIRLQHAVETWEKMTGLADDRTLEAENLRLTLLVMDDLL